MDIRDTLASALDEAPLAAPKGGWEAHNKQYHNGKMPDPDHCSFLKGQMQGGNSPRNGAEVPQKPVGASAEKIEDVDTLEAPEPSRGANGASDATISPEEDATYLDAVNRGDMETAARMAREAASRNYDTSRVVYHSGTLGTKDSDGRASFIFNDNPEGFHAGSLKAATERFSDVVSLQGDFDFTTEKTPDGRYRGAWKVGDEIGATTKETYATPHEAEFAANLALAESLQSPETAKEAIGLGGKMRLHELYLRKGLKLKKMSDILDRHTDSWREDIAKAKAEGYDGIEYENRGEDKGSTSYIVWNKPDVKSADPVTYDDNGNVVPLSQRFNTANPDIRYAKGGDGNAAPAKWTKKLRVAAQRAARALVNLLPGVKVEFSDKPYDESQYASVDNNGDERKSIQGNSPDSIAPDEAEAKRQYNEVVARYTNPNGSKKPGWMQAPNGKPTNLSERQWVQVRTPAFKDWFGDWESAPTNASKIVDENGEPKVVFNGGNMGNTLRAGELYTSSDEDIAKGYGTVTPLFLNIRNPRVVECNGNPHDDVFGETLDDEDGYAEGRSTDGIVSETMFNPDSTYDGVIFKDVVDNAVGESIPSNVYVPFNLDKFQAKHATENLGTFNRPAPQALQDDIRHLKDSGGNVVGVYNRRSQRVTLFPGATPDTVVHELAGHGAYQYAEQLAAKGNATLLSRMNQIADSAPRAIKDEVSQNYAAASEAVKREEVWAHVLSQRYSEAQKKALESKRGRSWLSRAWNTAKDAFKGIGSRVGLNRMDLSAIASMSPDETMDWLVKQMVSGKTLGKLSSIGDELNGAAALHVATRSSMLSILRETFAQDAMPDIKDAAKMQKPRPSCEATFEQCKAKNPMFCRYHGPRLIEFDIRRALREAMGGPRRAQAAMRVAVTKSPDSTNPYAFKVTVACAPGTKENVLKYLKQFMQTPGIKPLNIDGTLTPANSSPADTAVRESPRGEVEGEFEMDALEVDKPPQRNSRAAALAQQNETAPLGPVAERVPWHTEEEEKTPPQPPAPPAPSPLPEPPPQVTKDSAKLQTAMDSLKQALSELVTPDGYDSWDDYTAALGAAMEREEKEYAKYLGASDPALVQSVKECRAYLGKIPRWVSEYAEHGHGLMADVAADNSAADLEKLESAAKFIQHVAEQIRRATEDANNIGKETRRRRGLARILRDELDRGESVSNATLNEALQNFPKDSPLRQMLDGILEASHDPVAFAKKKMKGARPTDAFPDSSVASELPDNDQVVKPMWHFLAEALAWVTPQYPAVANAVAKMKPIGVQLTPTWIRNVIAQCDSRWVAPNFFKAGALELSNRGSSIINSLIQRGLNQKETVSIVAQRAPTAEVLARTCMLHEFGHCLMHIIGPDNANYKMDEWAKVVHSANRAEPQWIDKVSTYAKSDLFAKAPSEAFAECFAFFLMPTYKRGTMPIGVEDFIEKMLHGQ